MSFEWMIILLCVFLILLWVFAVLFNRKRRNRQLLRQSIIQPQVSYTVQSVATALDIKVNSLDWQKRMQKVFKSIAQHNICRIYFVSGTFVGDDPFDIASIVQQRWPKASKAWLGQAISKVESKKQNWLKDRGFFAASTLALLQTQMPKTMQAQSIAWSSGNHHAARLVGALKLLQQIKINQTCAQECILLFGHSHAGQIFAILTQMLASEARVKIFKACLEQLQVLPGDLDDVLKLIAKKRIFFVTLGSPVRYQWMLDPLKHRALALVNHRGHDLQGIQYKGIWTTRDGDYIQLLGVAGSDSLSPVAHICTVNDELNYSLGPGFDPRYWHDKVKVASRLNPCIENMLVDYKDQGRLPNFHQTVFGHAIYTQKKAMLFQFERLLDFL